MEAPEKIYFTQTENGTHYYTEGIPFERNYIEYIRKDAFIEKVSTWFANRYQVNSYLDADDIEDFINYMKGE